MALRHVKLLFKNFFFITISNCASPENSFSKMDVPFMFFSQWLPPDLLLWGSLATHSNCAYIIKSKRKEEGVLFFFSKRIEREEKRAGEIREETLRQAAQDRNGCVFSTTRFLCWCKRHLPHSIRRVRLSLTFEMYRIIVRNSIFRLLGILKSFCFQNFPCFSFRLKTKWSLAGKKKRCGFCLIRRFMLNSKEVPSYLSERCRARGGKDGSAPFCFERKK